MIFVSFAKDNGFAYATLDVDMPRSPDDIQEITDMLHIGFKGYPHIPKIGILSIIPLGGPGTEES